MDKSDSTVPARSAVEDIGLDDPLPFDRADDRPEPEHPGFVWVKFAAERVPDDGLDYTAEPQARTATAASRNEGGHGVVQVQVDPGLNNPADSEREGIQLNFRTREDLRRFMEGPTGVPSTSRDERMSPPTSRSA